MALRRAPIAALLLKFVAASTPALCPLTASPVARELALSDLVTQSADGSYQLNKKVKVVGGAAARITSVYEDVAAPLVRVKSRSTEPTLRAEGGQLVIGREKCSQQVSFAHRLTASSWLPAALLPLLAGDGRRMTGVVVAALWTAGAMRGASAAAVCTDQVELEVVLPQQCAICVTGCAPYSEPAAWWGAVNSMNGRCDAIVHVGDLISKSVCNKTNIGAPLDMFKNSTKPVLYAIGDNECNDCFRMSPKPADFYKAADARRWLVDTYVSDLTKDLTGKHEVQRQSVQCPFNAYVEKCGTALVTLEVPGSYWYLHDERSKYPDQDTLDPLAARKQMYDTAKDCALSWLDASMGKVKAGKINAMLVAYHANIWDVSVAQLGSKEDFGKVLHNKGLTGMYSEANLGMNPYKPLADKLLALAEANPSVSLYTVHADHHYWRVQSPKRTKNFVDVMVEGSTPGMTSYARFTKSSIPEAIHGSALMVHEVKTAE